MVPPNLLSMHMALVVQRVTYALLMLLLQIREQAICKAVTYSVGIYQTCDVCPVANSCQEQSTFDDAKKANRVERF